MSDEADKWDAVTRAWMRDNLARAASHFGLVVTGEPHWGWCLRSISTAARSPDGMCWLRVGAEHIRSVESDEVGDFWTGIPDSNVITGVAKPTALMSHEWDHPDTEQRVRADVTTLLPGTACSPTDVLRAEVDLPDHWWQALRQTIDKVRSVPTKRFAAAAASSKTDDKIRAQLGIEPPTVDRWETAHRDLHWANLLAPTFGLLDWEMWGLTAAGNDAARLHAYSLLAPTTAQRVYDTFADVLESRDGQVSQVRVAARLLDRAPKEFPDLEKPLREHIEPLIKTFR